MNNILRLMILQLVLVIAGCASSWQTMTAAGDEDQDIGLGGTGMLAAADSGLGGTGIVGEITGYGSIFVNGIEIEYHQGTPFTVDGEIAKMQSLAIGDVVEVLTTDASKHTQAQRINLRHEVVGKVTVVDAKNARFTVLGQTVINSSADTSMPQVGDTVAVSGFRIDERVIQATRVTLTTGSRSLLQKAAELPFPQQAERWLIQAHARNEQVTLQMDGVKHVFSVKDKTGAVAADERDTVIMLLQKTASGEPAFERVLEPVNLQRGRQMPGTVLQPGGIKAPGSAPASSPGLMQRTMPGSMRISPNLYRGG